MQRPFQVATPTGTVVCLPPWLLALLAVLLAGVGLKELAGLLRES